MHALDRPQARSAGPKLQWNDWPDLLEVLKAVLHFQTPAFIAHINLSDLNSLHCLTWLPLQLALAFNGLRSDTTVYRLVGLEVKASDSRAEGPGFESRLRRDFFGVESYQWLKHWHSSGYPARRLAW